MNNKAKNVVVQVLGGTKQVLDDVSTIGQIKAQLGVASYTASINCDPVGDSATLSDGDFVSLSQAVKGGLI